MKREQGYQAFEQEFHQHLMNENKEHAQALQQSITKFMAAILEYLGKK